MSRPHSPLIALLVALVAAALPLGGARVALAESGAEGWLGVYGWVEMRGSPAYALYGGESLRVVKRREGRVATFQPGVLVPGRTYTFSVYARLDGGGEISDDLLRGWVYAGAANPGQVTADLDRDEARPGMSWREVGEGWYRGRHTFTAAAPTGYYGVLATSTLPAGATYYLDGWQLEEGAAMSAYGEAADPWERYLTEAEIVAWNDSRDPAPTGALYPATRGNIDGAGGDPLEVATIRDLGFGPSDVARVERMIRSIEPRSPLVDEAELIFALGQRHRVDPLLIAHWQLESQMGTTGRNSPANGGNMTWQAALPYAERYGCVKGSSSLGHDWASCPSVEAGLGLWFNYVSVRYQSFADLDGYINTYNPCSDPANQLHGFPCGTRAGELLIRVLRAHAGPAAATP